MPIYPGTLRDKIGIYNETTTKDSYNGRVKTYVYAFSERTETTFASAAEAMHAQLQTADKIMKFKVYFRMGRYNEKQVIKYRDDYYNITSIDEDRDRTFTTLTAYRMAPGTINISG